MYLSNECKKIGNRYQSLGVPEPIKVTPMSDVTEPDDQIYHNKGKLLCLIGFSGLKIFKGMHAVWNFQLLVEQDPV